MNDYSKKLDKTWYNLGILIAIPICYGLCLLFPPSRNILADHTPYTAAQWIISLLMMSVPFVALMLSSTFRQATWENKLLWFTTALLFASMVHSPRLTLDVQIPFFVATVLYAVVHRNEFCFRFSWTYMFVVLYFLWYAISLTWSTDVMWGKKLLGRMIPLLSFPFCFLLFQLPKDVVTNLLKLFWRVSIVACVLSFCSAIYEMRYLQQPLSDLFSFSKHLIAGKFYCYDILFAWSGKPHPSFNALWQVGATIIALYLWNRKEIHAFDAIVSCMLFLGVGLMAQSRICLILCVFCYILAFGYVNRQRYILLSICVVAIISIGIIFYLVSPEFFAQFADQTREQMRNYAYEYIRTHRWLGSGIGGMTTENMRNVFPHFRFSAHFDFYPHHQFLGDGMQGGLIGLLLLIGMILSYSITAIKRHNVMAIVYAITIVVFMLIEMPFYIFSGVITISFIGSFLLTQCQADDTASNKPLDVVSN